MDTLLRQFNGDLHLLSQYLKIMNNRMVLLNPNFSQKDPADVEQQTDGEKEQAAADVEPVAEEHAEGGELDEGEALAIGGKEDV